MRIPCNRKVLINGKELQLKKHPDFKMIRNQKYKTVFGSYKDIFANFTVHKKKGKNNSKQIVFIISNLKNLTPKEHVLTYSR